MTQNLLDKHPGSRHYIAHLHSYGATREQICAKLAEKFPMRAPSPRSMTTWLNSDPELTTMIRELAAIKSEMAPGDDSLAELPEPVNQAAVTATLFELCISCPPFAELLHRDGARVEAETGGGSDWGVALPSPDDPDDDQAEDDVSAVLRAGHTTDAAFRADCERRLGDYSPHQPIPGAGSLD